MAKKALPLKEVSIEELFLGNEKSIYEIPIYQRNYAWEKDEITTLVQDVFDAYKKDPKKPYYIGTLVSYHKGDGVYEVIDGQQRLTTIRLLLSALDIVPTNKLTYRARKKSDDTIKAIPNFKVEEKDSGIENGYKNAKAAIGEIVTENLNEFTSYFKSCVHIIHYQVPKDIDLNHYFEIMNSRGEQLEKHEIVKANLMEKLDNDEERRVFNKIWECCAEMSIYSQQNLGGFKAEYVYSQSLEEFVPKSFEELLTRYLEEKASENDKSSTISISDIISSEKKIGWVDLEKEAERKDSFQPIIDFPNFLLIVLKIVRMKEDGFSPIDFQLDDKELINEFYKAKLDGNGVRQFAYTLLKARFLLDNYVVHHSKEEDTMDSNPWKLQVWSKENRDRKGQLKNLSDNKSIQDKLVHLLSMFEVSFTARQRKNYLFYCLLYLLNDTGWNVSKYAEFVERLADNYFCKVYLDSGALSSRNTPMPGAFDEKILRGNKVTEDAGLTRTADEFYQIYGDGRTASNGIPLFIFNYLDYRIWKLYDSDIRGNEYKEGSRERQEFFEKLGCSDYGLNVFDQFYFSRTRRSLEHYYPQAMATGESGFLDQNQINCLGNYAMIGSEANSSGSNWSPKTKLDHYLDSSGKIGQISVASLKFMIMMQMCKDESKWEFEEISIHQQRMLNILLQNS
ncbi:DUF262 domain-containing protein [Butyrivibrio sp.]|uniref:DUF262 domain-containing protein n=1 Tax=Butyrivibrio sp. TaxID=28121 RepID=UPI0025BE7430|nr:DUF262 domain-containing protein [Butyrivibrio sp.]MBQ9301663.1 DUF262 domain-containing protein [Butyrivibrio sp.]